VIKKIMLSALVFFLMMTFVVANKNWDRIQSFFQFSEKKVIVFADQSYVSLSWREVR
jgi:hypothetical protein